MKMKNMQLSFMYVVFKFDDKFTEYTFVTPYPQKIETLLKNEELLSLVPIKITIVKEQQFTIHVKKEHALFMACNEAFLTQSFLRYPNFIHFESNDIDDEVQKPSFKKLLNMEDGSSNMNHFLHKNNIFKSYYNNQISFVVKSEREEYSREFGIKKFPHTYELNALSYQFLKEGKTTYYEGSVFSSVTQEKIVSMHGINDNGVAFKTSLIDFFTPPQPIAVHNENDEYECEPFIGDDTCWEQL